MRDVGTYGNPGRMQAQVATVRAIYDAFERRDLNSVLDHLSDDFELVPQGTAELVGRTEPYRGHDGVREYLADAERVWRELTLHADDIRATANGVVVFGHVTGRTDAGTVRRRAVWMWRLRGEQAVWMRVADVGPLDG